jgi:hypothetical protein
MVVRCAGYGDSALFDMGSRASPRGPLAGRAVSNQIVQGLAATMLLLKDGTQAIHESDPKTCPFYYNKERDPQPVHGHLRFDAACPKKLKQHLPKDQNPDSVIQAFNAILDAFKES